MKLDKPKINGGIITSRLNETKKFYIDVLGFEVKFDADWYCLLHCPDNPNSEVAFMQPNQSSQDKLFQKEFSGHGVWFTIEVPDVDSECARIKQCGTPIKVDIRNEEWGDRHFAIVDPNGIGIDIVTHNHCLPS